MKDLKKMINIPPLKYEHSPCEKSPKLINVGHPLFKNKKPFFQERYSEVSLKFVAQLLLLFRSGQIDQ